VAAKVVRAVLTGGPGAGKSTLLEAMRARDVRIVPEAARAILQSPNGMAMRADRPVDFAMAMLDADLAAWHAADSGLSFYDRGFPDIVGFSELEGLRVPASLDRICNENRYSGPIFRASPWFEIYVTDAERTQDWDQAVASDEAVTSAWKRYGYELIDLPQTSVIQRADFVMRRVAGEFDQ
jgi:predicted ATPase